MRFTPEQECAICTHDRNLIVTAGAGSGKTRVLVERFMSLLYEHPEWALPSIVAITFTEKAAREMRDRVRAAVTQRIRRAVEKGDTVALERWLAHQAALTRARIGTIHSLCAQLLRANPVEAALDPAFEVLDENEAEILRDEAVEDALVTIAADNVLAELLVTYGVSAVRTVLAGHVGASQWASVAAAIPADPAQLMARWAAEWRDMAAGVQRDFQTGRELSDALYALTPEAIPMADKLAPACMAVIDHRRALLEGEPEEFHATAQAMVDGIKLQGGAASNWGSKERVVEVKALLKSIRDALGAVLKSFPPQPGELDEMAAAWLLRWREAIGLVHAAYTGKKDERAALDFDDLEMRTHQLLMQHPAVVARYAGREFNQVLVDEFQDTNAAQRDIAYALAGIGQRADDGRLFVVGDPKQSIYAFRGADVGVFGAVRDDLIAQGGAELPLSQSFRTHENLVRAFNDLFTTILGPDDFGTARYEVGLGKPMSAFRPALAGEASGHDTPLTVIAVQRPEDVPSAEMSTDDLRRWEAALLADHIHGWVRGGRLIWDRHAEHADLPPGALVPEHARGMGQGAYRPARYGDVAVLFQATTHQAEYEDVFKREGMPYITIAGRGYFGQQEVNDLRNLLSALHNTGDDLALAAALRSPLFGLSDEALFALRLDDEGQRARRGLWSAVMATEPPALFPVADRPALEFARGVLRDLHDLAGRAPIADVLRQAIAKTAFLATLTGLSDGARRRGNVEKFVALARESGRVSLGAFNAYVGDLTAREVREGEAVVEAENAVRLMSVHASKGLEFPVVILADATWMNNPRSSVFVVDRDAGAACTLPELNPADEKPTLFAWEHAKLLTDRRDQAERRRLLYVGATRAGDHLVLSGAVTNRTRRESWLAQWLAALGVDALKGGLIADDETGWIDRDWGSCQVIVPATPPAIERDYAGAGPTESAWDDVVLWDELPDVPVAYLPLLAAVPVDEHAPARNLTASQLAKLGRAASFDPVARGYAAFRNDVLHDAPEPLRPLPEPGRTVTDAALRRTVGEMVHRALLGWLLRNNTPTQDLINRLDTFAWELELTDPHQRKAAVAQAMDLLLRFEMSPIRTQIERAPQVYREMPFVYGTERRVVRGVIDVLYFDGKVWHVLDYKTAPVKSVRRDAEQYYLQVGAYAAAVEARIGQAPDVHLYYIHPARLWDVRAEDWRAALARLDDDVQDALTVGGSGVYVLSESEAGGE